MYTFIGRDKELRTLQTAYESDRSELVVVYGRRRIGKTALMTQFCKDKAGVYFAAKRQDDAGQRQDFNETMKWAGAPVSRMLETLPNWEAGFRQLAALPGSGKKVMVLDEFPYMAEGNPTLPSLLQHLWDHELQSADVMIVLCGSALSFMEKEVLSEKSPLFGRATRTIKVEPMLFDDVRQFFPQYDAVGAVLAYSVLGGTPYALNCFDSNRSVEENIREQLLSPSGRLWDYPTQLIAQECREPGRFNDILRTVATGSRRFSEIASKTVIQSPNLPRYLRSLAEMGFVERSFPADQNFKEKANSQRGLYDIADNLVAFWYRYVWPNFSVLNMGGAELVWKHQVTPRLNEIASFPFEEVCRQYLEKLNLKEKLPFAASRIGRWWDKNEEIDILAVPFEGGARLFGECKFRQSEFALSDYVRLKKKAQAVPHEQAHYVLFSKSGFAPGLKLLAQDPNEHLTLVTLDEVADSVEKSFS